MGRHHRRHQRAVAVRAADAGALRAFRARRGYALAAAVVAVCVLVAFLMSAHMRAPSWGEGTEHVSIEEGVRDGPYAGPSDSRPSVSGAQKDTAADDDGFLDACAEVLERHKEDTGSRLLYSGYLDLFGNVWVCLVAGEGWAELDVVRLQDDGMARASAFRLDASELQNLVGEGS